MSEQVGSRATVLAPAKINLVLRVLGRRPDGYHDIDTLFQAIDLCDRVEVRLTGDGVDLEVEGADLGPREQNLAHRAAQRFVEATGTESGVHVRLEKRIPVGAGLGGGSSDAAAVLRCLARLIGGPDAARLREIGAELGSDVPFFLGESALARGRGRGEVLEWLPALSEAHLVLVSPPVHVSTAEAYGALATRRAGADTTQPPPVAPPPRWADLAAVARNDFQPVLAAAHPEVARGLAALHSRGAAPALMTGSGSTCFGLFEGPTEARAAAHALGRELGWSCTAVRTLQTLPAVQLG